MLRWGGCPKITDDHEKSQSLMKSEAVLWYDGCVSEEFADGRLKEAPA
jgi:hypothetical protein